MQEKLIERIINKLKDKNTRWDAVLYLKELHNDEYLDLFLQYLVDPDPFIRATMAEKLSEFQTPKTISSLLERLKDSDPNVREVAHKSLLKFGISIIPEAIIYFNDPDSQLRKKVTNLFVHLGLKALKPLEKALKDSNWIQANHILGIIWKIGGYQAEDILIAALDLPKTRKSAIILLGVMRSQRAVPKLLSAYKQSNLKSMILSSLSRIDSEKCYPLIIKMLSSASYTFMQQAKELAISVGVPILPFLVVELANPKSNKKEIIDIIFQIDARLVQHKLVKLAEQDSEIKKILIEKKLLKS
jgi:HEAT repeat protein